MAYPAQFLHKTLPKILKKGKITNNLIKDVSRRNKRLGLFLKDTVKNRIFHTSELKGLVELIQSDPELSKKYAKNRYVSPFNTQKKIEQEMRGLEQKSRRKSYKKASGNKIV